MKERAYNFSAGPSMLPEEVIRDVADNLLNYHECGESVMEMSHRSAEFKAILAEAEADLRDIMNIPDNYKVLFIQGGGTLQFAMVPLNLAVNTRKIDFILTGNWAKKAYKEAVKMGYDTKVVASSEEDTFTYIPEVKKEDFRPDADYVHICYNNTIYGTHYPYIPDTGDVPLVADMSSCILSEEIDVTKFGMIWAGVQKNIAPSGVAIAIVREESEVTLERVNDIRSELRVLRTHYEQLLDFSYPDDKYHSQNNRNQYDQQFHTQRIRYDRCF